MSETEVKKPFRLHPSDFSADAGQIIRHSAIKIPAGIPIEATNDPAFWSMLAKSILKNQYIWVETQDNSYSALLRVRTLLDSGARTEVVWQHFPVTPEAVKNNEYIVKWAGASHKFRVVRQSDGEVVKYGFENKEEAEKYVTELGKQLAA